jgi:hypothetical protein
MAIDFGTGPILKDACPWLRDDARRHEEILDVTERDSVIEGLPPFAEETWRQLREKLSAMSARQPTPRE